MTTAVTVSTTPESSPSPGPSPGCQLPLVWVLMTSFLKRPEIRARRKKRCLSDAPGAPLPTDDRDSQYLNTKPLSAAFQMFFFSLCLAEDGALLGKIEKVRVLRNDRREGKTFFLIQYQDC